MASENSPVENSGPSVLRSVQSERTCTAPKRNLISGVAVLDHAIMVRSQVSRVRAKADLVEAVRAGGVFAGWLITRIMGLQRR